MQICEFANASPGPPTKVAYLKTKTLYLSFQKEGLVVSFLLSCIGKCFSARLQTLLISCWPQQEMFRCSQFLWRRGMRKTSRRYPEFATVGHIEILDIGHQWTAAQQWKWTTIDCNTRLASLFQSRWNEEIVRNRKWQYYSFCDDSLIETSAVND